MFIACGYGYKKIRDSSNGPSLKERKRLRKMKKFL